MTLRRAILVRPFTCTYLIKPSYSRGRCRVNESVVSYMWLSASYTGKSSWRDGMDPPGGALGRELDIDTDVNIARDPGRMQPGGKDKPVTPAGARTASR